MKKTLNVNIGSLAFTIDEDACDVLKDYLDDISSRLEQDERAEVIQDVEGRIADIFRENLSVAGQVVDIGMVRRAMVVMGKADCFGERRDPGASCPPPPPRDERFDSRKLRRSRSQRIVAGICGGIAEYMGWDATLLRVIAAILFLAGGLSLWVYIILWIIIPNEPLPPYDAPYNQRS